MLICSAIEAEDVASEKNITRSFKKIGPVEEPVSRYGNPQSYEVDGKTYSVLQTAKGYTARGIASWYGIKFHKKRTSSGEIYDMYALTAAHKTLPLPSYVSVKNLQNGREVIVRINDRGPFHEKRIIDLSYAAALKLGMLSEGTALVEVKTLKTSDIKALYYVQAGAFQSKAFANALKKKIERFTPSSVSIDAHDHHFVVMIGPFPDRASMEALQSVLDNNGIKDSFSLMR